MEIKQKPETKKARAKVVARKRPPVSGAAKLRQAASQALLKRSKNIVASLAESAEKHLQSAKFIYELAALQEELGEDNEGARTTHCVASQLAAEPEWPGDMAEADTKTTDIRSKQLANTSA